MRRPFQWLTVAVVVSVAFVVLPSAALAGGPRPAVEGESASSITATDATLEAQIDPGSGEDGFSLATTYEFFLESPWCGSFRSFGACEASGGKLVYKGVLPAGSAPQLVSVDLAGVEQTLSPSTTYGYRVVASNEAGEAFGGEKTFTTLPGVKAPVIESVSISHLTPTDATLEAKIDTEDLETEYAFQLWSSPCSKKGAGCELIREVKLPTGGRLYGSLKPQSVSLDLNSAGVTLGGGEYGFTVVAANKEGSASAFGGVFEAPPGAIDPPSPGPSPGVSPPAPTGGGPSASPTSGSPSALSNGGGQQAGAGTPSSPVLQVSSSLGGLPNTGTEKPKPEHGKHHKLEHHGTKAAKHGAKAKKHRR
jgi:hypothetical protein